MSARAGPRILALYPGLHCAAVDNVISDKQERPYIQAVLPPAEDYMLDISVEGYNE